MTGVPNRARILAAVALALLTGASIPVGADRAGAAGTAAVERHHYSIDARVRPLLFFWISRHDVGDAVVTRRRRDGDAVYSLLIGSDPDRAPRRINRWGYIEEEVSGEEAHLVGLMTQSDEESLDDAKAGLRHQEAGDHPFKLIRGTVDEGTAKSVVMSVGAPQNYSFHQLRTVLDLAKRESEGGSSRTIHLPPGTRPGFLVALDEAMRTGAASIPYVYYGRIYDLRRTHARAIPDLRLDDGSCGPAVAADFVVTSRYDGEETRFSMTYGTEGRFANVPLKASYRPRWWLEVGLTLDDRPDGALPATEPGR